MADKATYNHLVGLTAHWIAGARALESQREDRLFNDPWAAAMAGELGQKLMEKSEDKGASLAIRIRFFDDFLLNATRAHGIRQVVLMAAGLDTRAFRLNWPEQTRIFELDQAPVLAYKEQILQAAGAQAACARQTIPVDLTASWKEALIERQFDAQQPTVWLIEGLFPYLTHEARLHLLEEVTSLSRAGGWMGFDVIHSAVLTSPWTRNRVERMEKFGTPWIGTMDDPEALLSSFGWHATVTPVNEKAAEYHRQPYPFIPPDVPNRIQLYHWFVTAHR